MSQKKLQLNKRTRVIIILVAILVILATSLTFLGIFLYQRYTPEVRYAKAQENWAKTSQKKANDELSMEIVLGQGDNTLSAILDFSGTRTYNNKKFIFDYEVLVQFKGFNVLFLNLIFEGEGKTNRLKISKTDGMIDFQTIDVEIDQDYVKDLELGKNTLSVYNTKNITIDNQGGFLLEGDNSVSMLLDSADLIIKQFLDLDIKSILKDRSNIGRVTGNIEYNKAFQANSMKNSQNISFFMTWEDADELVENIEEIPENIREMYNERKVTINDLPLIGSITLDLMDYLPDGILINISITNNTNYEYNYKGQK